MTEFDPHRPISLDKPTARLAPYDPHTPAGPPVPPYGVAPAYSPGYPPTGYSMSTTTVAPQQSNAEIIVAWIVTGLTLLYMLPWAVAATRRSTNSVLIAIATFFLAWTVLGWVVLLVLSFLGPTVHSVRSTTYVALTPPPPPGMWAHCPTDPPHVRRWWDGRSWTVHTTVG